MTANRIPRSLSAITAALAVSLAGCPESKPDATRPGPSTPPGSAGAPAAEAQKPTLTVLVTADELGWLLLSEGEGGQKKGGAAELLGQWVADEKHCPAGTACKPGYDATVVLSTGNHWNGPAISSFFRGESTAEVMKRMGYQVSVLGTHELDFGRDQFLRNRGLDGIAYVAANLKVKAPDAKDLELPPFKIVERKGVKLGVVGLARTKIAANVMAGRLEGLEVTPYEEALAQAVPAAVAAGADAVVVLVDECPSELEAAIQAHPDWKIPLVAGGHCHKPYRKEIGGTVLASPGQHFERYLKATMELDPARPQKERLVKVDVKLVDAHGKATPDAEAQAMVKKWKEKADGVLGEEIGFTKTGLDQASPQIARWVSESIRSMVGADVAIVNKKGLRQGLPAGKITRGSVYSVLPYDNSVLVAKLSGEQLLKNLENPEALFAGAVKSGKAFKDAKGKAIDPAKMYSVATVEYLYFGGDQFDFEQHDPLPNETGMVWQTPVIEWTKAAQTTAQKPLESKLK
ncbi:MAG TPA: 5'-nucleotidase C-terminal domain-containing protein [Myxococcales bacterium]|nr:5'-nucleotidase C-terminal domain-containing protein [Myxococcales bacterium]